MMKLLTRLALAVGGLAFALTAGAGVASADPNLDPMVNTSCSYSQVMAALEAEDPAAASQFNSSPMMQSVLHQFLGAPQDQRQKMAQSMASHPANQPYIGLLQQVFNTCSNY